MQHKKNAIDLLSELVKERNWHRIKNDKPAQRAAAMDKLLLQQGRLSYEKCCQWLERLGYKKVEEEVWSQNNGLSDQ